MVKQQVNQYGLKESGKSQEKRPANLPATLDLN